MEPADRSAARRSRTPPTPPTGGDWDPQLALQLARTLGLTALNDRHWKVITTCREEAARSGVVPRLERITLLTHFDVAELHQLFPGDTEAVVSRIAGLERHAHRAASPPDPRHPGSPS